MRTIAGSLIFPLAVVFAQDAPVLFTAATNNVIVDAAVTGDRGQAPQLTQEDFLVLDSGKPVPIAGFAHEQLPLDIVLVCQSPLRSADHVAYDSRNLSAGLQVLRGGFAIPGENFPQRLVYAAGRVAAGLRPGDRAAIVSYGRDPHVDLRFTEDRKALASAIKRLGELDHADSNIVISSEGLAIEYAARMIADAGHGDPEARTNRRRLIIVISNIFGVGVRYADEPLIRRLWDGNIVLSTIDNAAPKPAATTVQRTAGGDSQTVLFERFSPIHIAQATGGDRIVALEQSQAVDLLEPVRQRYTLWFSQPPDASPGESRTVKVELSGAARRRFPEAQVRAREGYIAH